MSTLSWSEQRKADTLVNLYVLTKWAVQQAKLKDDAHKRNTRVSIQDMEYVLESMVEGFIFDIEEAHKNGIRITLTEEQITALRRRI